LFDRQTRLGWEERRRIWLSFTLTCQKWEEGFYNAYAHMADEELDLVVFLGDYAYAYGIDTATGGVRGSSCRPRTPRRRSVGQGPGVAEQSSAGCRQIG
jgi:phosphodiesterase/alkaline phosphatase D-like protein